MNTDSIYPDIFKAGIGRLRKRAARDGDFLGLFAALERFRHDLTGHPDADSILATTGLYLAGLDLFETLGFFLIDPASFDFRLAHCSAGTDSAALDALVRQEMEAGHFAWALRQNAPVFFSCHAAGRPATLVFHTLGVASRRLGMFCGIVKGERAASQRIVFNLLSILLGACSDALAGVQTTAELRNQVLAANESLERALRQNEILARIPAESPNPVLRLDRNGQVLYCNTAAAGVLRTLGCRIGDMVSGEWLELLADSFTTGERHDFERAFEGRVYAFLLVPVPEAGYANFYGTDITERKLVEAQRLELIRQLQEALAKVKTLRGLVPICAWCKKIRDDSGFWNEVEVYVQNHSTATFSHGVCPSCQQKWMQNANLGSKS